MKSLLDALVACGMLVDDSIRWLEVNTALWTIKKGERRGTVIVLTDLEQADQASEFRGPIAQGRRGGQ